MRNDAQIGRLASRLLGCQTRQWSKSNRKNVTNLYTKPSNGNHYDIVFPFDIKFDHELAVHSDYA